MLSCPLPNGLFPRKSQKRRPHCAEPSSKRSHFAVQFSSFVYILWQLPEACLRLLFREHGAAACHMHRLAQIEGFGLEVLVLLLLACLATCLFAMQVGVCSTHP